MNKAEFEIFMCEYKNRLRIFEDSQRITQSTNDFEVFKRRADTIIDFIIWSYQQKENGVPIKINQEKDFAIADFNRFYNSQCVRIAKHNREKATKRTALKLSLLLCEIRTSLKDSINKNEAVEEINNICQYINELI